MCKSKMILIDHLAIYSNCQSYTQSKLVLGYGLQLVKLGQFHIDGKRMSFFPEMFSLSWFTLQLIHYICLGDWSMVKSGRRDGRLYIF